MNKLCARISLTLSSFALAFLAYAANAADSKITGIGSTKPILEHTIENGILKSKTFRGIKSTFVYEGAYLKKTLRSSGIWLEYFYDRVGKLQRAVSSNGTVYTPVFDSIGNLIVLQSSAGISLTLDGPVATVHRGARAQQETEEFILKALTRAPTGRLTPRGIAGLLAATDGWDITPANCDEWLNPAAAPSPSEPVPTTIAKTSATSDGTLSLYCGTEEDFAFVIDSSYTSGFIGFTPSPAEIETCKRQVCDPAYNNNVTYCNSLAKASDRAGCHALNSVAYGGCLADCGR